MTASPLNDIRTLIAGLPGPDEQARAAAASALAEPGALGRLDEIALWLAAWRGEARPEIRRPIVALFAGAPGPGRLEMAEAMRARLEAIAAGGATVSRMAAQVGAGLEAFDLAIDRPIGAIAEVPALGEREAAATMAFGMEVLAKQPDLLLAGEVAGGDQAPAAALALALFGGETYGWIDHDFDRVTEAVGRARREDPADGLDWLRQLGGREIAAVAGAILAARNQKTPVILDGYGACAAAAVLQATVPGSIDHCLIAAAPAGSGHARLVLALGRPPLLDLGFQGAEGTGAIAALSMVKLAGAVLSPGA
ncbi:nicotinate-nucleotide--dimethylbenzimidazole phosphoribosyltransferase [soil metagenome]